MTGPIFVDTNVLLYAVDNADPAKHHRARQWRTDLWKSGSGRTSYQVLEEFYVNVCRLMPEAREHARAEIRDLLAWRPVVVDDALIELAWETQDRYRVSFWDALIVAAAISSSCRYLLTEDLQADQDFGGVRVVNPFSCEPDGLL